MVLVCELENLFQEEVKTWKTSDGAREKCDKVTLSYSRIG